MGKQNKQLQQPRMQKKQKNGFQGFGLSQRSQLPQTEYVKK